VIRILTLSNKPHLLPDAIRSVEQQSRLSGVKHIVEIDDGSRDWGGRYPPNVFWNEQLALADPDDYMIFLSDDDLLMPNAVYDLAGYLDSHAHVNACYGAGDMYICEPGKPDKLLWRVEARENYDGKTSLAGRVGSGMCMWRAKCWQVVGPWPEQGDGRTPLSDGDYFTALARLCGGLRAVNKLVVYTRITPWSAHTVPDSTSRHGYTRGDWRRVAK